MCKVVTYNMVVPLWLVFNNGFNNVSGIYAYNMVTSFIGVERNFQQCDQI